MSIRLCAAFFLSLLSIVLYTGAASAFELASGYPQRTNTKRAAPLPGLFDLEASNVGINRADCLDSAQRWRFAVVDVPADTTAVEIWARGDGESCAPPAERFNNAEAKTPHCYRVAKLTAAEAAAEFEIDNLSIVHAIDKKANFDAPLVAKQVCGRTEHMTPTAVHLHLLAFKGTEVAGEIDYVTLYDLGGPPAATGITTGAGEGLVTVKLKAPSSIPKDFKQYLVYCFRATPADAGPDAGDAGDAGDAKTELAKCPADHPFVPGTIPTAALDAYKCGEWNTIAGDVPLDVRENDVPYAIAVAAIDRHDNFGILSEVVCETPRATDSYWDKYNAAGGRAGGGYCAIGGPPAPMAVAACALVLVAFCLRRRGALAGAALLLWPTESRADRESPSIVLMEARFGPYRPRADRGLDGTPYKDTFGDAARLMVGAEVDVVPLHLDGFGSIGFGALVGYTRAKAKAEYANKSGRSEEDTAFNVWVLSALATVRVDVLARKTRVPIVPYGKLGLMTGLWSSTDGRGVSRSGDGREARGRTNGFLYAVGAMLLLDAFDPEAAKAFATERGVKHSYVFGELTVADLRGFGQTHPMKLGDVTWTAGVAFEM